MALTIHTEEDEQRQLKMSIEVPEDRVQNAMKQAARKLARDLHIPGFRRGKAPYRVIVRRFGEDTLRAEVVEEMVQSVFEEAVEQTDTELYAPPSLDSMELQPLVYKFTVPLAPQMELGEYREFRKEIEPVDISPEAIDEALERIQARHQVLEEVDRPVQKGDLVSVSGKGVVVGRPEVDDVAGAGAADERESTALENGEEDDEQSQVEKPETTVDSEIIFDEESIDFLMDTEKLFAGTPFVENMLGMAVGDEKSFGFVFPDDFADEQLAGREASFNVSVLNVQKRELPALSDELAQQEGDFQNLSELRESVSKNLEEQASAQAKNDLIESVVDDLMVDAKFVYPPAAVDMEIEGMVDSFKSRITRSGWQWEDFMKLRGDTEEVLRDEFREQAVVNLERRLVLRQFVVEEKLTVEEADVEAAVAERVSQFGENEELRESMSNYYRSGYGLDMISSEILMEKVYQRMEAIVSGNAPDLETLEDESTGIDEEE